MIEEVDKLQDNEQKFIDIQNVWVTYKVINSCKVICSDFVYLWWIKIKLSELKYLMFRPGAGDRLLFMYVISGSEPRLHALRYI